MVISMMYCIGLGNPGDKYERTRHNIGVRAIEYIQENVGFSSFMMPQHKQFRSATGKIAGKAVVLMKPEVFMNNSGQVAGHIKNDLQKESSGLIVIHDDVAIPFGKIRISEGRGAGGHNGVKSIIDVLGTKNFIRIRIGVAPHPQKKETDVHEGDSSEKIKIQLDSFVLKNFTPSEEKKIPEIFAMVREALNDMFEKGIEVAMNKHN